MFDKRRAGGPRGSERRARDKVAQMHSGEKKHVTQQQGEHVIELQRRAGTHGSFTEASRNTRLNYRGEQEHIAHLQRRSGRCGSSTGESSYRRERNNVAQLFRRSGRAGTRGSSTEESRITWLIYRGEQDHVAQLKRRAGSRGSATE